MQNQNSSSLATSLLLHDLRTPAATAKAALDIMFAHDSDRNCVLEMALIIKRNLELMEFRLNSILDTAKTPAQARLMLRPVESDIGNIVREVRRDLELVYGQKLRLRVVCGIKGFWDSDCIRRVLENLIVNGFRYGKADGLITVSVRQDAATTTLSVHNEGTPIDAMRSSNLFHPFCRGAAAEQTAAKGWGLGLAFVRDAVEAHGGRIALRSTIKEGTSFIVTLPNDARAAALLF